MCVCVCVCVPECVYVCVGIMFVCVFVIHGEGEGGGGIAYPVVCPYFSHRDQCFLFFQMRVLLRPEQ